MKRQPLPWTVRTLDGGYVGTWRHYTAKEAIAQAVRDHAVTASQFRGVGGLDPAKLTATVESAA